MAAYLLVNFSVDDKERYKRYQKGAVPSLGIGEQAKVLVYETDTTQLEGEGAGHQTVMLEYPTIEDARAAYESDAYQAVLPDRLNATSNHLCLLLDGQT